MKTSELGKRLGNLSLGHLTNGQQIAYKINAMLPESLHVGIDSTGDDLIRVGNYNMKISKTAILSMSDSMDVINEITDVHQKDVEDRSSSFKSKNVGLVVVSVFMMITTAGMLWNYLHESASNGHVVDAKTLETLIDLLKVFLEIFMTAQ
jgi:hypothetical protein